MVKKSYLALITFMVVFAMVLGVAFAQGSFENTKVNWKQFEGESISLLLCNHPMQATFDALLGQFEELTGIKVKVLTLPEQQFFERQQVVLTGKSPEFDIVMSSPMLNWKFIPVDS